MIDIEKLRSKGYSVKIRHTRFFPMTAIYDENNEYDQFLTRGEFNKALEQNKLVNTINSNCCRKEFCQCVSPTCGFTEVTLTHPNGNQAKGKYNFNNKPFSRRLGVTASLGRCFKQLGVNYEDIVDA